MARTVVITNDDGIDSPGLAALAAVPASTGDVALVAAPAEEASGTSAGLTAARDRRRVPTERRELAGLPDVEAYALPAHPGLIALMACREGFGPRPDVLLSGINRGANVGRAVLHSGTVGAALTAGINGVSAMAVSLATGWEYDGPCHWSTAADVVARLLPRLLRCPPGTVLNVNVPNVPADELLPARWARLAQFGVVQARVRRFDGEVEVQSYWSDIVPAADTDDALVAAGHVTVTALTSVAEGLVQDSFPL